MRSRVKGWIGLAAYVAAAVIHPGAHLLRHAAAGEEHAHDGAPSEALTNASADLVALGLEDVGAPAAVDCSLAAVTLVDCETPSHGARRFGDDSHRQTAPSAPTFDPRHGAGSAEHLGVSILAAATFTLPAPNFHKQRLCVFALPRLSSLAVALTHDSRGPPATL